MEEILDVYHRPYDEKFPLVCLDEQPLQMVKETRASLPCESGKPMRYDYQYERAGVANIFFDPESDRRGLESLSGGY